MSSSGISMSGLISGLDSASLISQIMSLERQPVTRMEAKVADLTKQKDAIRSLRTQLSTLRSRAQDFRYSLVFNKFKTPSSDEDVLTAEVTGSSPVSGAYEINVTRLASATDARSSGTLGGAIDPTVAFNNSGIAADVTGDTFTINGVEFTIDADTQSLNDILGQINSSAAGVTATYNAATDKVTIANTNPNDTSLINLGAEDDDSTFLQTIAVTQSTQATNANGSTELGSTRNIGAIDGAVNMSTANFSGGSVTAGNFTINGITITVDPATDSLSDVIARINDSDAQVTASYDATTDSIRMVSKVMGSRTIRFASGTSNFLDVTHLTTAVQTAGKDSQFTINGGAVQTRNSNEVGDAVSGVTLKFLSTGTSTVTIGSDDDAIVEGVEKFVEEFNNSIQQLNTMVSNGGLAEGDGSLRIIQDYLRTTIFGQVSGAGEYQSLAQIGITTGDSFDAESLSTFQLDTDTFLEALRSNRSDVEKLFSNRNSTGVADQLAAYLDGVTSSTGFLNDRIKSNGTIDQQISAYNDRIERLEDRLTQRENRLKAQYARLETMSSTFKAQSAALSSLGSIYSSL